VAVAGLGCDAPTWLVSNHVAASARDRIRRSPSRTGVADCLGRSVHCFPRDGLASAVRLPVDVAVALTGIAPGCARGLASKRRGFDKAKATHRDRRVIDTSGVVAVEAERIVVSFDERSHKPWRREAAVDGPCSAVAWLGNRPVTFDDP
jgi:hypothetical protein